MNTIELSLSRTVNGKTVLAHLTFSADAFEEQEDQGEIMMEAYEKLKEALDEAEVDLALAKIKNLNGKQDIPIQ